MYELFILFIIKLYARIDIFKKYWYYIYENSKTPKSHALIINLTDKLHFKRGAKSIVLSNFSIYYA